MDDRRTGTVPSAKAPFPLSGERGVRRALFTPGRFRAGSLGTFGEKQGVGWLVVMTTLVTDRIGTLSRMAALLGRLGMDIISVTVSPTPEADVKRITLAVEGPQDEDRLEREFLSLADILEVRALPQARRVDREWMLVKTPLVNGSLPDALLAMGARVLWQGEGVVISEVAGDPAVLRAWARSEVGTAVPVLEAVVTGYVSLWAGADALKPSEQTGWGAPGMVLGSDASDERSALDPWSVPSQALTEI